MINDDMLLFKTYGLDAKSKALITQFESNSIKICKRDWSQENLFEQKSHVVNWSN